MTEEEGGAPARVVVADDQTVVREGIVMLLGLLPGIEVVGAAADGHEAVRLVAELDPDVVLMDLRMPRCDGVEATRRIRAEHPRTQVVVLTTYADDASLFPALRAGARGYLTKDAGGDEIVRAVRSVLSGDAGLSPGIQRRLLERLSEPEPAVPAEGAEAPNGAHRAGDRGARADRRRSHQPGDRSQAPCLDGHRENPHQQPVLQDGAQGPCAGGPLRLREGTCAATRGVSHLMG